MKLTEADGEVKSVPVGDGVTPRVAVNGTAELLIGEIVGVLVVVPVVVGSLVVDGVAPTVSEAEGVGSWDGEALEDEEANAAWDWEVEGVAVVLALEEADSDGEGDGGRMHTFAKIEPLKNAYLTFVPLWMMPLQKEQQSIEMLGRPFSAQLFPTLLFKQG